VRSCSYVAFQNKQVAIDFAHLSVMRRVATVALSSDIIAYSSLIFNVRAGLKQALDKVNDYNLLMKDFPLNDLLSATELHKLRQVNSNFWAAV